MWLEGATKEIWNSSAVVEILLRREPETNVKV